MRVGDIIVNPYVPKEFDGELNAMYATIYLGNNTSLDFKGRRHKWGDRVYEPREREREWRVIGHHDFRLFEVISEAVEAEGSK